MGFLGGARQVVPDVGDRRGSATWSRPRRARSRSAPRSLVLIALGRRRARRSAHGAPGPARSSPRGTGPGIRSRVSSALRSGCGEPSPRMVDVALTVAVGVPVVGTTLASGLEQDRVLAGLAVRARRDAAAAGPPALAVRGAGRRRWRPRSPHGRRAVRAPDPGRALHDRLAPLVGGDGRRRGRAASPPGVVYMLAGGTEFTYDDLIAVGLTCAVAPGSGCSPQPARTLEALASAPSGSSASASCWPSARSPRSACGSRRSCTTSSRTTSSLIVVQAQALGATVARRARRARRPTASPTSAARRWPRCTARCKLLRAATTTRPSARRSRGSADLDDLLERSRAAGLRRRARGRGRAAAARPERRPVRVPDRPGGADQRASSTPAARTRRCTLGYRPDALELIVADSGDGAAAPRRRRRRPRPGRHARARGAVRRHAHRRPARRPRLRGPRRRCPTASGGA